MSEPLVVVTSDDSSPSAVVVTQSPPPVVVVSPVTETRVIVTGIQGPPGPPGDSWLPDPAGLADGRYITALNGQYIDIPAPAGSGDMQTLIYDPQGIAANVFDAGNLFGNIDGGVFT